MIQREYIGFNIIESVLTGFPTSKIFLVTGKDSYHISGAEKCLGNLLRQYEVSQFSDFSKNPKIEDAVKGIKIFEQAQCNIVIAVGGGSIIDMAKLINFFAANKLDIREYLKVSQGHVQKSKPLIAIPTTAGSGSEATSFAVLYIDKEKFSVDNEFVLPDVAIVDPALMKSLPKYVTATTGMDALSQAIESYWNINSNDESKRLAKDAIELIMDNLVTAVNAPSNSARLAMAKAANLAGKAINITRTTVPHAISYPLTSYFGIAHGHAVALTLPAMLEYNAGVNEGDVLDVRGCEYVRKTLNEIAALFGKNNVAEAKEEIYNLMCRIGLETKLSSVGIESEEDIQVIIDNGFNTHRVKNNPRRVTREALMNILEIVS